MNRRYLLGIALATAAAVAACGDGPDSTLLGSGNGSTSGSELPEPGEETTDTPGTGTGTGNTPGTGTPAGGGPVTPGNLPTNSKAGKDYFTKNVMPFLDQKCGGCHAAGGAGTPTYIVKGDASATYDMIYLQAYATATSRIVLKGLHSAGGAPELTQAEKTTWAAWIQIETADGGQKTQTNVLEKFGTCFDKAKFDAINFGQLRTTRRQNGNNPLNQNENANNCTGCDNAPCRTCHSADDVTGFVMAIGNPILPADYTFEQTKLLNPAFIRQYVSTTPTGDPIYNPGVKAKSTNSIEKGLAYSHPMYRVSANMETAIQAFVDDAIAKHKAGTCGK